MQKIHQEVAVRERAYAIWEAEGRPEGREHDHWHRAARELAEPAMPARKRTTRAAAKTRTVKSKRK